MKTKNLHSLMFLAPNRNKDKGKQCRSTLRYDNSRLGRVISIRDGISIWKSRSIENAKYSDNINPGSYV